MRSYFDFESQGFNPYQVLTIYPTELSIFGSHTFHELMIADQVRMLAFRDAITLAGKARPNAVWVDIGSGLCPLSLMAAKWGQAKKVYAIEQNGSALALARKIIDSQDEEIRSKITLLPGVSFGVDLPEKADILLTETIGNFGLEEGVIDLINDAKLRLLKEDGVIIPEEIEFIMAPIESSRCYKRIEFWQESQCGLNFKAMLDHAANTVYHHRALPQELISRSQKVGQIKLSEDSIVNNLSMHAEYDIERDADLHGFIGWFRANLYNNIFLTNDPLISDTSFNWTQAFFPLNNIHNNLTKIKKAEKLNVSIDWDLLSNELVWNHNIK